MSTADYPSTKPSKHHGRKMHYPSTKCPKQSPLSDGAPNRIRAGVLALREAARALRPHHAFNQTNSESSAR